MILDERARWMGFWTLDRLRGGKVRKSYDEIRDAYRRGTSRKVTDKKLRSIISHAVRTTEFYSRFDENVSLTNLPIVNKDTYRANYDAFLSSDFSDKKGCRIMCTSGSTGTPLQVVQDPDKIARDTADGIFFGAMAGYYIGMRMAFIRVWVNNVRKSALRLYAENMIMAESADLSDDAIRRMLDEWTSKRVKVIVGYASALSEICKFIDRTGYDVSRMSVRSIIPISEAMPAGIRERLAELFDCPVQSWYSNEENGIMGIQPRDGDSYYIDTANYYYEILKLDSDEPAAPGEIGRIVITDLNNRAMPVIRYDNGDLASYELTDYGTRYRLVLKELYGRRSDIIYDTKGGALTPFVITNNLWDVEGVRQFQFIQTDVKNYIVRLNADKDKIDEADIMRRIGHYFGDDAVFTIEYVDEIPVLNSGKRKYIMNLCEKYK
jgi:phenylacetate-CoA ligase